MALFDITDQPGVTKSPTLKNRLFLAALSDVDIDNWPLAAAATISTNVLLPNKTFKFIDALTNTINANAQPGESPYTGKLTLTPTLEGLSKITLDWVYKNVGSRVIAIWERCADGQKFIGGTPCSSGLTVKYTSIGALDGGIAGIALSLEGGDCPDPFYFYDGPIPRTAPVPVTVAAGVFELTDASQYLITDNSGPTTLTDITGVTDPDVGRIIELQGAGVNNPTTIASSAKFILQNGLSFSALVGSSIHLQITKTGGNAYAFYEVLRS
jgi:hypothetical protein